MLPAEAEAGELKVFSGNVGLSFRLFFGLLFPTPLQTPFFHFIVIYYNTVRSSMASQLSKTLRCSLGPRGAKIKVGKKRPNHACNLYDENFKLPTIYVVFIVWLDLS